MIPQESVGNTPHTACNGRQLPATTCNVMQHWWADEVAGGSP